jgi:hypothetical protein
MARFHIRDNKTDEIISTVDITDEDEFMEVDEMAEHLGFYLEVED